MDIRDVFHKLIDRTTHNSDGERREMHAAITSAFETEEERTAREEAEDAIAAAAEPTPTSGPTDAEIEAQVEKRVAAKLAAAQTDKVETATPSVQA